MHVTGAIRIITGFLLLGGLTSGAQADIYVYQLPGGARIVTDHPLNNRDYRLVRHSRDSKGAGALISNRNIQHAVTDPNTFDRLIRRNAAQHQVDPALIKAVMHIESAFNPHAVSNKGAQGLMQVMPETGQRYGAVDLFDPVQNVRAASLYLKDLQKLFKNNTRLVLAAYNAGENAVLRYKGIPPYNETQGYVRKVMKMHRQYQAKEKAALKVASSTAKTATTAPAEAPSAPAVSATQSSAGNVVPVAMVQQDAGVPVEKNL